MDTANTLTMNGNVFEFEAGETLLDVARRNNIDIPTLCHLKGAIPTGACRVCVVEVEGARTLLASCATPAGRNMVVHTESQRVVEARRDIIRLLLASGNHNCAVRAAGGSDWTRFQLTVLQEDGAEELCPVWGDCRLQDLAYRYQVNGDRYVKTETTYPMETGQSLYRQGFFEMYPLRPVRTGMQGSPGQQCHRFRIPGGFRKNHRRRRPSPERLRVRLLRRMRAGVSRGRPG